MRISTENLAILAVGCNVEISSLKDAQELPIGSTQNEGHCSVRRRQYIPSSRLSLISVDDEVSWSAVGLPVGLVHEGPLEAGGESSTSSATETRVLDLLNDPRVALEDDILRTVPVAAFLYKNRARSAHDLEKRGGAGSSTTSPPNERRV